MKRQVKGLLVLALVGLMAGAATGPAAAQHAGGHAGGGGSAGGGAGHAAAGGGAHQHLDARYSHNQYYFDRGYAVPRPPPGSLGEFHGSDGARYYYHGGNWYRWRGGWYRWWGGGWVIWGPPFGLFVPFLPPFYTTIWWDGIPYYYANDTYYVWNDDSHQYEIVAPPAGIEGATTEPPASDQLFVYPKTGQSTEQQSKDRYECHQWAVQQSGFDPTAGTPPASPDKRDQYFRAEVACLEGRGYTVK